jgi:peptidylprolyl isomerase
MADFARSAQGGAEAPRWAQRRALRGSGSIVFRQSPIVSAFYMTWMHKSDTIPIPRPTRMPRRMARPIRLVLTLIAVAAVFTIAACGDDDDSSNSGGSADTSAQQDTATETTPSSPGDAEAALKDTSKKPVIPKPTGSPPNKLVKEDIVVGKGPGAKAGDTVVVHYVGMNFSNGKEFDASWDTGQPFPVQLGQGMVIAGWDKGLIGIKKGGRRKLTIPPELGYGAQGYPPDIPPNETLVFVVDAISIN